MSTDEEWKNEMLIYEKYLKEDFEDVQNSNSVSVKDSFKLKDLPPKTENNSVRQSQNVAKADKNSSRNSRNGLINHLSASKNTESNESKEKIAKLQSSVDNLRKNFHSEHILNDELYKTNRLEAIKRSIATRKIQKWYRRHNLRRKAGEAALKRYTLKSLKDKFKLSDKLFLF